MKLPKKGTEGPGGALGLPEAGHGFLKWIEGKERFVRDRENYP